MKAVLASGKTHNARATGTELKGWILSYVLEDEIRDFQRSFHKLFPVENCGASLVGRAHCERFLFRSIIHNGKLIGTLFRIWTS